MKTKMMKIRSGIPGVAAVLGLGVVGLCALSSPAQACGGLFCDGPPPDPFAPLPVAQNGENIVFAIEHDPAGGAATLTAHIQILYTGSAAKFSWVVPVDSVPTLGVGTDQLFASLAGITQPVFQTTGATEGTCLPDQYGQGPTFDSATAGGRPTSAGTGGSTGAEGRSVTVAFQGAVGPFDTAVIHSTDPMALKTWLIDNGYIVSDAASAIIDDYVRQSKYFVALKLLNGKDTKSIQPIVLTFKGNEACVPLRLTAIAANPDMPVRLWVLSDRRAVPKNFFELKIDELRIDWANAGSNYGDLLKEAANKAGGNAFVAEYAGTSSIATGLLWTSGQFDLASLRAAMTPPVYVQALVTMGLAGDPQTLPLLAKYIPMPSEVQAMGVTDSFFYGNLAMYWAQYSFVGVDLVELTNQIDKVIIQPRRQAQTMIDAHTYLTRLNTFISPEEMGKDAFFTINRDLGDVSNIHTAIFRAMCGNGQYMACNAPIRMELSDGRKAWVRTGSTASTCNFRDVDMSGLAGLPAAEIVWQRDETGEGSRVIDNTGAIDEGLKVNNAGFGGGGCGCRVGASAAGGVGLSVGLGVALALWVGRRRRGHTPR